ncbi:MAG: tetratricopeptide repeat protein [Myxococcota bacterium]
MISIGSMRRAPAVWALGSLLCLAACSGAPPKQANTPDPALDDSPSSPTPNAKQEKVVPASSSKVQKGIDAIQNQDFAAAKAVLTEAESEAPKDPQAAFYLGVAYEGLGETGAAEKQYRKALELDPKLVDASANLSAILVDGGKTKEALPIIENALKLDPKKGELLVNYALALSAEGKTDEALKAYGDAVQARPDALDLRLAYAEVLAKNGKSAEALEQLRVAAKSDDPKLLGAVADNFGKLKAPADCVAALDRALKSKASPALQVRRGVCRHDAGDAKGAREDFEAALKLDPKFAAAHYYLGMDLRKSDKKAAQQHFQKAIEADEKGPVGKRAKAELDELKKKSR